MGRQTGKVMHSYDHETATGVMTPSETRGVPARSVSSSSEPAPDGAALPSGRIGVLHLLYTMAYGGVDTTVINWLRKIDRDRFDVHLVCFANPGSTEMLFPSMVSLGMALPVMR